jgi:hypothetical protein
LAIWDGFVVRTLVQALPYMAVISLKTLFAALVFFSNIILPSFGLLLGLTMTIIIREKFESLTKEINAANLESNRKSGGERSLEDEKISEKYQELMCL